MLLINYDEGDDDDMMMDVDDDDDEGDDEMIIIRRMITTILSSSVCTHMYIYIHHIGSRVRWSDQECDRFVCGYV